MNVYKNVSVSKYKKLPRGIRNNNPLNIRASKKKWMGLVDCISIKADANGGYCKFYDRSFCQFSSMMYGIRAACRLLLNYQGVYGLTTIREIIYRWAPPKENNTASYAEHVACALGCNVDDVLNLHRRLTLARLVNAMIEIECGSKYGIFSDDYMLNEFDAAFDMIAKEGGFIKCT